MRFSIGKTFELLRSSDVVRALYIERITPGRHGLSNDLVQGIGAMSPDSFVG